MATMTAIERVSSVLTGEHPDRPPVSFWHHFAPEVAFGQAAVDAHLDHLRRFDLDFLKVMNDNEYPTKRSIKTVADLRDLPVLGGDEAGFGLQLELIRALAAELSGKVLLATTMFNSWAVLRKIVAALGPRKHLPPTLGGPASPIDARISDLLAEDRAAVGTALEVIAASLASFARRCIEAGTDGIFLSVRDDRVDTATNGATTYEELVEAGDRRIIDAAGAGKFNLLHVCGIPRDFDRFAAYPVHVVNWADRAAGPPIRDVIARIKPVCCGGVDNLSTLPNGTADEVTAQVRDALDQAGDRPMIVGAGCTYDPDAVPPANLEAMVRATRETV